jgi:hypothetical protein
VPGIYFAGTLTQGFAGLRKHGIPSNSGAVQGHRYNARVMARHLAEARFARRLPRPRLRPEAIVPFLLSELTLGPELWHQRAYLARVVSIDPDAGALDEGVVPLAHFVDAAGPDAVAVTLESNGRDDLYPVAYLRRGGTVSEAPPLPPHPTHRFEGEEYARALQALLAPIVSPALLRR